MDTGHKLQFQYRHTLNELECWKIVDLRKRGKGRSSLLGRIQLLPLYSVSQVIKAAKKKDLTDLLQYIPPIHHSFYHELIEGEEAENEGVEEGEGDSGSEEEDVEQ